MRIEKIDNISLDYLRRVLTSDKIDDIQKAKFINCNRVEIKETMQTEITSDEYKSLMDNRAIQKFRPLKNSYTKWGDKILLGKALNIPTSEVSSYVNQVSKDICNVESLNFLPADKLETIKTYVYRHGSKDELVSFLDYELSKADQLDKALYRTLKYHSGGVADYFIRPIHRMYNKTLVKLYNTVTKHLNKAKENGTLSEVENDRIAKWALVQIYHLQNNSKLINAIKTYKTLK